MSFQLRCEEIYENSPIKYPIIGAVIKKYGEGHILADDENSPNHIFVISNFGFCQELYFEYNEEFENLIHDSILYSKQKLRLYNPNYKMREWLKTLGRAKEASRIHYWGKCRGLKDETDERRYSNSCIIEKMLCYNNEFDFGLNLKNRYYRNCNDFIRFAKPICISSKERNPIGVIYAAGYDGFRNEVDIYVLESYRGLGIAKRLVNSFYGLLSSIDEEMTWDCYADNTESRRLADNIGFEEEFEYALYNIEPVNYAGVDYMKRE